MTADLPSTLKNEPLVRALRYPNGARFYKCALQLNTWRYLHKNNKPELAAFVDEGAYNAALVRACVDAGIEVASVTDHSSVDGVEGLSAALTAAGVIVFPGFEAKTTEGVHLLCLFNPGTALKKLERCIGASTPVSSEDDASPPGKLSLHELLREARDDWGAVCIAAHALNQNGVLRALQGAARTKLWKEPDLLAAAIPGTPDDADQDVKQILKNQDKSYRRAHPMALVNAGDVNGPSDVAKPRSWCRIKMSSVTVEGLRQAFIDPESRVRLSADAADDPPRTEIQALAFTGGLLGETGLHLNPNLNVLIGGRGAGKSTVVESLRYVLDRTPLGDEAGAAAQGIVRHVLRSGTKVSLLVRSSHPSPQNYVIERTVPNPPQVKDEAGNVLPLSPRDVIPLIDIFGQHEISEVARSDEKRTQLLQRFVSQDPTLPARKRALRRGLEQSRARLLETRLELAEVTERLGQLGGLEERQARFQRAGLEDRLKDRSALVREERVLKSAEDRLQPFAKAVEALRRELPIDRAFLSPAALEALPGRATLAAADAALVAFEAAALEQVDRMQMNLEGAQAALAEVRTTWTVRQTEVEATYEKILRELQKTKIDGAEFIQLKKQIEDLRPLRDRESLLQATMAELLAGRRTTLDEWQEVLAAEQRALADAAKKVQQRLRALVQVKVDASGNRLALARLLGTVKGLRHDVIQGLLDDAGLSVLALAQACRDGKAKLRERYGLSDAMADKLASADERLVLEIEEIELGATTSLSLNVGTEHSPSWKTLEELSTGQKATAVLLLLLLDAEAPLIIDQPEDDLDNRFITQGIVERIKEAKMTRQFIFATHNANIPVLGDAELIIGLTPKGEDEAHVEAGDRGSIDDPSVQALVEAVLEGGKVAFEQRRRKYGFES